ncbi:MAG: HK97 gp10 family phage protein [Clostridium baratii]|uniref:HK97 gp10 family phage protein n=1 Tax=Clostridium baratii TaxID=1561 RepID=UPI00242B4DBA|nr:HK97 gp10 family phage protein [Clostridium baratii]MBS6006884.1 HK97 gp10 family phage protein [Clostridium baratii]
MSIHVENHFEEYAKKLVRATAAAAEEVKITELAEMQSNTPVKTGALKRSETAVTKVDDSGLKITWGSPLVYAKKVEFKDKSYIRSTLKREIGNINRILNKHLKEEF